MGIRNGAFKVKAGKITEPQCKRSVLKWLPKNQEAVIQGAGIGRDYSMLQTVSSEYAVFATSSITLSTWEPEYYAFQKAMNKLEASGATPCALMISVFLPARGGEERIRRLTQNIVDLCKETGVNYLGGHTELVEALRAPIITVTVYGDRKCADHRQDQRCEQNLRDLLDILVVGPIALETTRMLLADQYEELHSRYAASYLQGAKELCRTLSLHDAYTMIYELADAGEITVPYIHNLSTGGIYAGLWELGEACKCGVQVELKQIPILQETIEVCEYFDINPYMTFSGGCALILTGHGEELIAESKKRGIWAIKIGQMTTGNDRIVISGDVHSYLTPPKGDDCYKIYGI